MKTIPVLLLGAGGVGRALIQQIIDGRETVAARAGSRLAVRLVADSQRWVRADDELSDADLKQILQAKQKRETVGEPRPDPADMVAAYAEQFPGPAILVDVTAGVRVALDVLSSPGPMVMPVPAYHPQLRVAELTGRQRVDLVLDLVMKRKSAKNRPTGEIGGVRRFAFETHRLATERHGAGTR